VPGLAFENIIPTQMPPAFLDIIAAPRAYFLSLTGFFFPFCLVISHFAKDQSVGTVLGSNKNNKQTTLNNIKTVPA
jgi:hypothetical protein